MNSLKEPILIRASQSNQNIIPLVKVSLITQWDLLSVKQPVSTLYATVLYFTLRQKYVDHAETILLQEEKKGRTRAFRTRNFYIF